MSDCQGCPSSQGCASKGQAGGCPSQQQDLRAPLHPKSKVKHVIGVVSGKGGVGKSSVTSLLVISLQRRGYKVGILDADITGPSIPHIFGVKDKAMGDAEGVRPCQTKTGIQIMSSNLLLEHDTDPVVLRGPLIGGMVKQFYSEVIWEDIDYLLVDMPPGTGDVALTVYQSLNLDGIILVTSPQDLVSMIVEKAVKMADLMKVPIIGVVENYAYFHCPDNDKDYNIFGQSHVEDVLKKYDLMLLKRMPIRPEIAELCDKGLLEDIDATNMEDVALPR